MIEYAPKKFKALFNHEFTTVFRIPLYQDSDLYKDFSLLQGNVIDHEDDNDVLTDREILVYAKELAYGDLNDYF